jgi:ABC-2 type transport system ATP-binding protein
LVQFWQSVRQLDGVIDVSQKEPREPGENLVTFELQLQKDVREAVIAFLVTRGFGVLQLTRSHRDLETVFLQLSEPSKTQATNSAGEAIGGGEL